MHRFHIVEADSFIILEIRFQQSKEHEQLSRKYVW